MKKKPEPSLFMKKLIIYIMMLAVIAFLVFTVINGMFF